MPQRVVSCSAYRGWWWRSGRRGRGRVRTGQPPRLRSRRASPDSARSTSSTRSRVSASSLPSRSPIRPTASECSMSTSWRPSPRPSARQRGPVPRVGRVVLRHPEDLDAQLPGAQAPAPLRAQDPGRHQGVLDRGAVGGLDEGRGDARALAEYMTQRAQRRARRAVVTARAQLGRGTIPARRRWGPRSSVNHAVAGSARGARARRCEPRSARSRGPARSLARARGPDVRARGPRHSGARST